MGKYILVCLVFLFSLLSGSSWAISNQPLPVDKAFVLTTQQTEPGKIILQWKIAPGYHLYRNRFRFVLNGNPVSPVDLPLGELRHDDILGNYHVYEHTLNLMIALNNNHKNILAITYQGCSEGNFCYPPVNKKININDNTINSLNPPNAQDKLLNLLAHGNYAWICLVFLGMGILLAFTPCVLPMIPILSSIIVGQQQKNLNTQKAFFLSLAYVLGMSFMYAIAGVLVALAGSHLAQAFQTPWVIIVCSLLFVLLALSLFDVYQLKLPNFLHHSVIHLSNKQKTGSYIGVFIMGCLSVLIVSPCVTAPLVGILTYIGQSANVILGSLALFSLGLGMGIPLLIIGTTEGRFLPKAGSWMDIIKVGFGVMLLGVAITLLERILPMPVILFLWGILCILTAGYLWMKKPVFLKIVGLVALGYGLVLIVDAAMGNRANTVLFKPVKNRDEVQIILNQSSRNKKPVMLDFYADWCVACREMEKNTFSDPGILKVLVNNHFVLLQANVTQNDSRDRVLENFFGVIAPPTIIFFNQKGQELSQDRIIGGLGPAEFLKQLHKMGYH